MAVTTTTKVHSPAEDLFVQQHLNACMEKIC